MFFTGNKSIFRQLFVWLHIEKMKKGSRSGNVAGLKYRGQGMHDKKHNNQVSPDLRELQAVVIDKNTTIYIAQDADPEEARLRYLNRYKPVRH